MSQRVLRREISRARLVRCITREVLSDGQRHIDRNTDMTEGVPGLLRCPALQKLRKHQEARKGWGTYCLEGVNNPPDNLLRVV